MPPDTCPNCGAEVPPRARVCPECGSDESTGWSEEARYNGLDLPDDAFDYGDFVNREFGGRTRLVPSRGVSWLWWVVALAALGLFLRLVLF